MDKVSARDVKFDDRDVKEHSTKKRKVVQEEPADDGVHDDVHDDDDLYKEALQKQQRKKEQRMAKEQEAEFTPMEDDETGEGKRKISSQIEKNKGLRKKSKKELRNPRVKHKLKYKKAIVKRKSQVQAPLDKSKPYQGEVTGIKTRVVKSTRL